VTGAAQLPLPRPNMARRRTISAAGGNLPYLMQDEPGEGTRPWSVLTIKVNNNRGWLGFTASQNGSTRLLAEATFACDGDWPTVGRPCSSAEIQHQNKNLL
jgi:hypothetical protein